jgi:hypothetical protein
MDAIGTAFDRIDDFVTVQRAQRGEITLDAVLLLQEAVGVDERARATIRERLPEVSESAHAGSVLLGVLVGLLASEAAES